MLEKGWLKRQMESASATTAKWPDWMKQEAGIHQSTSAKASNKQEPATKDHSNTEVRTKEAMSA